MLSPGRRQLASIVVVPVERRAVAPELRLAAVLDVSRGATTEVRVRMPAFIEAVAPVEVGQRVRAGQTLVWATAPELARGVEELRVARGATGLGEEASSILSDATRRKLGLLGVPKAQADALARSDAPAGSLAIGAPVSGVVTARSAVRGGYAGPEDALFTITELDSLVVQATARAEDLAVLAGVTRAELRVGAVRREVVLDWVEPFVDAATRTATIRFTVANADGALRPGAIGQVIVPTRERPTFVLPRDAIVETGRSTYVYVEREEGYFEPRPVTVGATTGEQREIVEGVEEGERVVARGVFVLDSESRLKGAARPPAAPQRQAPTHAPSGARAEPGPR
jgi:Cu(I)/Ag(I) efflux system membrane fusion protein